MSMVRSYRYCIVPCCTSSSVKTPGKIFFSVPRNPVKRKAWTKAMKRDEKLNKELSFGSPLFCCEDHFSIPQDMKNYWQWRISKNVKRFVLKPNVVPHVFNCQKKCPVSVERSAAKKRRNMHLVQEAMSSYNKAQIHGTINLSGAVPSFSPCSPSFTSSEPSNAQVSADDKGIIKEMGNLKTETTSIQEQIKGEKGVQVSAIQTPHEKLNSDKSNYLAVISKNKGAIILLPINKHQAATSVSGTESQNVAEKPIVIKQEPVESINEPPWPAIEKIHGAEEIAPSSSSSAFSSCSTASSSSSSACGSAATVPPLPFSNPDSTNVDETSATHVPNKPAQKRKIDDTEPDAAQAKLCHLTQPSMPSKIHRIHILNPTQILHPMKKTKLNPTQTAENPPAKTSKKLHPPVKTSKKLHPPAKTSKKLLLSPETSKKLLLSPETSKKLHHVPAETSNESSDCSPFLTQNGEDATREMFESLLDGAENNPLFGSRTTGDLFDVFSDLIAGKLREMDWNDCAYALRVILDVVFKTSKVQHGSKAESDISNSIASSSSSNQE